MKCITQKLDKVKESERVRENNNNNKYIASQSLFSISTKIPIGEYDDFRSCVTYSVKRYFFLLSIKGILSLLLLLFHRDTIWVRCPVTHFVWLTRFTLVKSIIILLREWTVCPIRLRRERRNHWIRLWGLLSTCRRTTCKMIIYYNVLMYIRTRV